MAEDFVEQFNIPFPVYTDPRKETYTLMGWKRTFGLGLRSLKSSWTEYSQGHRQGSVLGDPWQQGGEALILQDGSLWWSHAANEAGTHSSVVELKKIISRFQKEHTF
jgi:hypothetical protein